MQDSIDDLLGTEGHAYPSSKTMILKPKGEPKCEVDTTIHLNLVDIKSKLAKGLTYGDPKHRNKVKFFENNLKLSRQWTEEEYREIIKINHQMREKKLVNIENFAPKDVKGKPPWDLVNLKLLEGICKVREYGVKKYKDPDNWKKVDHKNYLAAALRHLAWVTQEGLSSLDKESGLRHLDHALTNLMFLSYFEKEQHD